MTPSVRPRMWMATVSVLGTIVIAATLVGCGVLFGGLVPVAPEGLSASDGAFLDRVRVTWSPVPEAGGYEVWRGMSSAGTFTYLASTGVPSYDDTGVAPGTTYWYKVRACNRAGCSPFTPAKAGKALGLTLPTAPAGITVSQGSFADRIQVSWTAVLGATEYYIFRGQASTGPFTLIGGMVQPQFEDLAVVPGTTYWYRVQACNNLGCSLPSDPVSGYAASQAPPPPTGVQATDGTEAGKVVVTWQAPTGALNYLVYRALSQEAPPLFLSLVEEATYTDSAVQPNTTYWYWVRACNAAGCSALSQPDSGSPGAQGEEPPPPPPPGT